MAKNLNRSAKKPISNEDYITDKVLSVFCICLFGVLILMILQRMLDHGSTYFAATYIVKGLLAVGALGVLYGLYRWSSERKSGRDVSRKLICGRHIIIVSVLVVLMMTAISMYGLLPIKALYVLLPVLAVYYLIFHSYSPEFFMIALDCGIAAGLIWLVYRAQTSSRFGMVATAAAAAAVVLLVIQVVYVARVKASKGKMRLPGAVQEHTLSRNAYLMLYVSPAVMAALVAIAAILGQVAFLPCLAAAAAYLFVTAVYYTVKLM